MRPILIDVRVLAGKWSKRRLNNGEILPRRIVWKAYGRQILRLTLLSGTQAIKTRKVPPLGHHAKIWQPREWFFHKYEENSQIESEDESTGNKEDSTTTATAHFRSQQGQTRNLRLVCMKNPNNRPVVVAASFSFFADACA